MRIRKKVKITSPAAASKPTAETFFEAPYFVGQHFQQLPTTLEELGQQGVQNRMPLPLFDDTSLQNRRRIEASNEEQRPPRGAHQGCPLMPPQHSPLLSNEEAQSSSNSIPFTASDKLHPTLDRLHTTSCTNNTLPPPTTTTMDHHPPLSITSLGTSGSHHLHILPATWNSAAFRGPETSRQQQQQSERQQVIGGDVVVSWSKGYVAAVGMRKDHDIDHKKQLPRAMSAHHQYSNFTEPLRSDLEPTPLPPSKK
jgi:hypothetical protein